MSILDYFRKKPEKKKPEKAEESVKKLTEAKEKLIQTDTDPLWKTISVNGIGLPEKSATLLQEYMSWVYANISAIAEAVGDISFELYEVKGEDVDEVKEHSILELLHRPNQTMTKREFIILLQIYRLLTGESPIRIKRNANQITELWPLNPLQVTPMIGKTADGFEMVTSYEYKYTINGKQEEKKLKPDEVIFIKNMNPKDMWRGYGVVEAAQGAIDTLHYSELFNQTFFKNSAVPYTVLYTNQKLNENIINRLKNSWESNYKGPANAFKTAILEAGLKVEKLQQTSKDMDFIEQQKFLRDKMMAMFKTTKIALGITEDVNRANAEASEYVFAKNCVKPKMAQYVESFNEFLLPLFENTENMFLDFVDPVPKDRIAKVAEYTAAVDKWMTKNEIRDAEGLPPLEGGDEIWQPLALTTMSNPTPNTEEEHTEPQTTEEQEEKPKEDEEQKGYRILKAVGKKKLPTNLKEKIYAVKNRNIRLKQMKEEIKKELRKILKSRITPAQKIEPKYKDMSTKEDTDKYVKTMLANSDRLEAKMNDTMKWKYYQPQMEEVLRKIDKGTKFILNSKKKSVKKAVGDEFMFNKEKYVATGIDLLTPLLKDILLMQGAEALLTVKPSSKYSLLNEARKYLNQKPTKIAKTITDTAYERVRNSLADGIKEGESVEELKKRILEQYTSLEVYQAETIARTEVSRATNFATIDAFKQSGVVEGKEWIVTPDDRLCEFCAAMEETYNAQAKLDEDYFKKGDEVVGINGGVLSIGYDDIEGPPLHPNCRCVLKSVEKIVSKSKSTKKKKSKKEKKPDKLLKEVEKELNAIERANERTKIKKAKKQTPRKKE